VQLKRLIFLVAVALLTSLGGFNISGAATSVPHAVSTTKTVPRCGYMTNAGHGRLGLYIADGSVSCAQAARVMSRAFSNAPSTTVATGESLYADGWVCGGQMGGYSCSWPYLQFEANDQQKEVIALSCSNPGCPGSTTAQRTSTLPCSAGTPEGDGEYSDGSVIWVRGMTCEAALALIEPHHSELVGKRAGTTYVLDGFRCKVVYPGGPDFVDECVAGSRALHFLA
jgi:hypothetical protein